MVKSNVKTETTSKQCQYIILLV